MTELLIPVREIISLDYEPVPLEETAAWKIAANYWEAKKVTALATAGGEVPSGITTSIVHAHSLRLLITAAGLSVPGLRIVEYGAGSADLADVFAWNDVFLRRSFCGGRSGWEWCVTDLQAATVADMQQFVTYKDSVKFAVVNALRPLDLVPLPGQQLSPELTTKVAVANYLLDSLPWEQYRIITDEAGQTHYQKAVYQTVFEISDEADTVQNEEQLRQTYGSDNATVLEKLDWRAYQRAVRLQATYRDVAADELSQDAMSALLLSGGKETVVHTGAFTFLRSVMESLPEDGILVGSVFCKKFQDQGLGATYGGPALHFFGGSMSMPINLPHVVHVLRQQGYYCYVKRAEEQAYALLLVSKKEIPGLDEVMAKEVKRQSDYLQTVKQLDRRLDTEYKTMTREEKKQLIADFEALNKEYGVTSTVCLTLARLYEDLFAYEKATVNAKLAVQLSPHNQEAVEAFFRLKRMSYLRSLFV